MFLKRMRRARLLAALTALALVMAACSSGSESTTDDADTGSTEGEGEGEASPASGDIDCDQLPEEFNIGFQAVPNGDAITKAQGTLEGLVGECTTVNWITFDSGGSVNEAMASGSVDVGLIGSSPVTTGLSNGFEYEVPYIFAVIGSNEALVVNPDAGFDSVSDLPGSTIGVPFGSTTHFSLLGLLESEGVDPNEVNLVDLQPAEILTAYESGDIDGGYIWIPVLSDIEGMGGEILTDSSEAADLGFPTFDLSVVRTEISDTYPMMVAYWLHAQEQSIQMFIDDPEAAAEIAAGELGIDPADALAAMEQVRLLPIEEQLSSEWLGSADEPGEMAGFLQGTGVFLEGQGSIDAALSEEEYGAGIDPQFMELALELGS